MLSLLNISGRYEVFYLVAWAITPPGIFTCLQAQEKVEIKNNLESFLAFKLVPFGFQSLVCLSNINGRRSEC